MTPDHLHAVADLLASVCLSVLTAAVIVWTVYFVRAMRADERDRAEEQAQAKAHAEAVLKTLAATRESMRRKAVVKS